MNNIYGMSQIVSVHPSSPIWVTKFIGSLNYKANFKLEHLVG